MARASWAAVREAAEDETVSSRVVIVDLLFARSCEGNQSEEERQGGGGQKRTFWVASNSTRSPVSSLSSKAVVEAALDSEAAVSASTSLS